MTTPRIDGVLRRQAGAGTRDLVVAALVALLVVVTIAALW